VANPLVAPFMAFLGRLSYPKLFAVTAVLFLIDLAIPNLIPFDDIALGIATLVLANWRKKPDPAAATTSPPAKPPIEGQRT
jgi:hypothetical protein